MTIRSKLQKAKRETELYGAIATGSSIIAHLAWRARNTTRFARGCWIQIRGNRTWLEGAQFELAEPSIGVLVKGAISDGTYEADERSLLAQLPPDLPLIEIGSCIGVVSCLSNRRLLDPTRHVAVEANPKMLPVIDVNRRLNGASFRVLHRVIAYTGEEVDFPVGKDVLNNGHNGGGTTETIRIKGIAVASIYEHEKFLGPASLICDIEGTETEMIGREGGFLADYIAWLMVEFHPHITGASTVQRAIKQLETAGFKQTGASGNTVAFKNIPLTQRKDKSKQ